MSTCPKCGKTREIVHMRPVHHDGWSSVIPESIRVSVCPDRCDVSAEFYREPTPAEREQAERFFRETDR